MKHSSQHYFQMSPAGMKLHLVPGSSGHIPVEPFLSGCLDIVVFPHLRCEFCCDFDCFVLLCFRDRSHIAQASLEFTM